MTARSGVLSVERSRLFDLLRGSLYAGGDVALRELVANAADAVAKLRALALRGEYAGAAPEGRIEVVLDRAQAILTVTDDGLGMTAYEVERYLNEIAVSGAAEFLDLVGDSHAPDATEQPDASEPAPSPEPAVIGQFGVGFYSAFMLADRVEVDTLSWRSDAAPVHWECDTQMAFQLRPGRSRPIGTTVTLHLPADSAVLAAPEAAYEVLRRQVRYLPVAVWFRVDDDGCCGEARLVTDLDPAWRRAATERVAADELAATYREQFGDELDPLLVIPVVSLDIGLRGVVYLRDTRGGEREVDGRFDLYCRGIEVARDAREFVPTFLGVQSGIIECDALPLVVARSGVREEAETDVPGLLRESLSQAVTLRLHELFTHERGVYERLWPDIGAFVKYGALTDRTFASVMARRVLVETFDGRLVTLGELRAESPGSARVLYATDRDEQADLIDLHRRHGIPGIVLDHVIDGPLVRAFEGAHRDLTFQRVDADPVGVLADAAPAGASRVVGEPDGLDADDALAGASGDALVADIRQQVSERLPGTDVRLVALATPDVPLLLVQAEAGRRTGEFADLAVLAGVLDGAVAQAAQTMRAQGRTVVVNARNPIVARLAQVTDPPLRVLAIAQLLDLAVLGGGELSGSARTAFLRRSEDVLGRVLDAAPAPSRDAQ